MTCDMGSETGVFLGEVNKKAPPKRGLRHETFGHIRPYCDKISK